MVNEERNQHDDPYRRIFAESSVALAFLDETGFVVDANEHFRRSFESLSGRSLEGLDESFPEFLRSRDAFRFSYHFSRLITGSTRSVTFDSSFRNATGSPRWLKFRAWLVDEQADAPPSRRGPFVALTIDDETDEHREEKRLQEEKEIAERAIETKNMFLANMSHEIRTPIQTIIGMTELMQDTALNREQAEYARQVKFSADVLLSLINDILDYSKIEAGKLELEHIDFDLEQTVEQAVDMISLEAHKKGLEIAVDVPQELSVQIKGDPSRFRQIVINLVKNAVKFTKAGSVTVSARAGVLQQKPALTIAVADTGIGVPPDLRGRLFTTFFQGDASTTRRFGGTGLGLAISRHLVETMGGEIGMVPNEGGGSVFRFTIPFALSEFPPRRANPTVNAADRILVIDDRSESRRIIASYLGDIGYQLIEEAASGTEALDKMKAAAAAGRPFALCFVDMIMPQMDGWRLAAEINGDKNINQARLVLMVPQGMLGADAKMTLLKWFNAYINKPIKRREISDAVDSTANESIDLQTGAKAAEPAPKAIPAHRPMILIVEDHPVNQKLFALILEKAGYASVIADDGVDALEKAALHPWGLIFMDIQMPRMNGYDTTQKLRERGFACPIVAVTASALSDERERCLKVGMDDILVKPFKRPDIEAMLEKWLRAEPEELQELEEPEELEELEELDDPEQASASASGAAPPPEAGEPDKNVLDWTEVVETFFGKTETVINLMGRFVERTAEQVAQLPGLVERQDWETARREAHTIKGSALNLAAKNLGQTAARLELAIKNLDHPEIAAALPELPRAFAAFRRAVDYYLHPGPADKVP